jgi:hypothetical protein
MSLSCQWKGILGGFMDSGLSRDWVSIRLFQLAHHIRQRRRHIGAPVAKTADTLLYLHQK